MGRDQTCSLKFDTNLLHVSRKHCQAYYNQFTHLLFIRDTSTNGTYINLKKLKSSNKLYLLKNGDTTSFGKRMNDKLYQYKVEITPILNLPNINLKQQNLLPYQYLLFKGWFRYYTNMYHLPIPSPIYYLIFNFFQITLSIQPSKHQKAMNQFYNNSAITNMGFNLHSDMNLTKHFAWTIQINNATTINFGIIQQTNTISSSSFLCKLHNIADADILTMELNLLTQQITYFKNDKLTYSISIKHDSHPLDIYYMLLSIHGPLTQIKMLDYREY